MKTFATLSRRGLIIGTGIGAASLAAPAILSRNAAAQETDPMSPSARPQAETVTVGEFRVTTLSDGGRQMTDPHKIFGTDQPQEEVAALLEKNFLPADRMVNMFTPTLVETGSELILFDTGNGEGGREAGAGRMLAALEAAGHAPADVTLVVLTHFHGDHINGLTEGGEPTFANARYMAGRTEYDFWTSEDRVGTPAEGGHRTVMEKVAPLAEKMTFLEDGDTVVSGITGMDAFGHTPGHMIFMIEAGDRQLLLTADTANHFVLSLQRPDWEVAYDMDKAMAAETRKRVFDMAAADQLAFIGYHMPYPALGYVEKRDIGYRWVPETYQFAVEDA